MYLPEPEECWITFDFVFLGDVDFHCAINLGKESRDIILIYLFSCPTEFGSDHFADGAGILKNVSLRIFCPISYALSGLEYLPFIWIIKVHEHIVNLRELQLEGIIGELISIKLISSLDNVQGGADDHPQYQIYL